MVQQEHYGMKVQGVEAGSSKMNYYGSGDLDWHVVVIWMLHGDSLGVLLEVNRVNIACMMLTGKAEQVVES